MFTGNSPVFLKVLFTHTRSRGSYFSAIRSAEINGSPGGLVSTSSFFMLDIKYEQFSGSFGTPSLVIVGHSEI